MIFAAGIGLGILLAASPFALAVLWLACSDHEPAEGVESTS